MKTTGVLLLFALALCFFPDLFCEHALHLSTEYCSPRAGCTMEYIPHCGSDGITYFSKCLFCNAAL
ncbi:ISK6 inhibitor, partial [Bucco capensis]|nr:ISK6 inhibitor [Bucco capensis]